MFRALIFSSILCAAGSLPAAESAGKPFLHPLFTDGAVLQRDVPVPIWGFTDPGKEVTVSLAGKTAGAAADARGKWMVRVGPFPAGGPSTLTVSGPRTETVKDVLFGDVWICSGQSNMEMGIAGVENAKEEIASADFPRIRLFTVEKLVAVEPQEVPRGRWLPCSPRTVSEGGWGGFSAVGYFFGRHLHRELGVPIGLIHTSWGGTVAEAWVSAGALKTMPDFRPYVDQIEELAAAERSGVLDLEKLRAGWWRKNDPGSAGEPGWADAALDTAGWKSMDLPGNWEQAALPGFDGVVWFRKTFDLPAAWEGKDLLLHLGPIDDADTTWVNGVKVGSLAEWTQPRDYRVPAKAFRPGRNAIAVRVLDTAGNGGFVGKPQDLRIEVAGGSGGESLSLAGGWSYRETTPLAKAGPLPGPTQGNPNNVTVLSNGMIAPLIPFAIRGAIWYQGESNAGRALQYRTLLPVLIKDWRSRFGVGDFPFLIVELANFMETKPEPGESQWAELREAQLLTARAVPAAAVAVAIDIGDARDIHPKNKQEVGRRLALAAEAIAHGRKVESSGPLYKGMEREGRAIRLSFDHLGGGLVAKGGRLQGFAIAGEDRNFVWAEARIDGDTVVVSSPKVEKPVAVRYAWADNPVANLYNQAGLPASPFRTDIGADPGAR